MAIVCMVLSAATVTRSAIAAGDQYAEQQIKVIPAKKPAPRSVTTADANPVTARTPQAPQTPQPARQAKTSQLARAAHGQSLGEMPPQPLDGSIVRGSVRQVGFLEDYGRGCGCKGAICDCADPACGIEPLCGFDGVGRVIGPGCGLESHCGCGGPSCGIEGCGCQASLIGGPACGVGSACGVEAMGDCGCDACAGPCSGDCIPLFLPVLRMNWCRFDFFAGVQGYTGPMNFAGTGGDRAGTGSFGFYQGFNEGRSLKRWLGCDISSQLGLRATQSNLSGSGFTDDTRQQIFLTGGLFRRVDFGLQYGVVLDYLNDDWYFQGNLTQIRGELSWNTGRCHTFGYQGSGGTRSDTSNTLVRTGAGDLVSGTVTFEATDQHRLFYRRTLAGEGFYSAFAGWTNRDDGLLGATLNLPLRQKLLLQTGATYLIPNEGRGRGGNEEESWNLAIGLVYRPGGAHGAGRYSRPMFDVADNGTFMVDRR